MEYPLCFHSFSDSLKKNTLVGLSCKSCGEVTCPPRAACLECNATDLEIVSLNGTGILRTFTSTFVPPFGREAEAPYIIVLVELDEGPWIIGNLSGTDPSTAGMELIGKRVKLDNSVFRGDLYSAGEAARPLFILI
jgi:uncharacterized OB-fold protein